MKPPRSAFRRLAPIVLAVALSGCASTGPRPPAPPEPGETERPVLRVPEPTDFAGEIDELVARGETGAAETMLRERLASPDRPETDAELRLLLARLLVSEERDPEALVELVRIPGSEGGEAAAPRAWDEIARIRRRAGDERGAVRASMNAYDRSAEDGRRRDLVDEIAALRTEDVSVLASETLGFRSNGLVQEELRARRIATGRGDEEVVTVLAPLSGRFERFGAAFVLGARLALEDRDTRAAADSARVIPIRLVTRGTDGDLLTATRQTRAAIQEDGCVAIVGPLLSVTSIGAAAVAESYGIPLLAPTATDPELPGIGPHVLTLSPDPDRLARPLASLAVGVLGKTRFGVLLARDGVSQDYESAFREAVEALGGEVVVSLAYDPDERDFRRLIERFDEQNVDAVYIPGSVGNLEALAVQLDFYEFGRMILGNGGWTDARILDPGNLALEGAIFSVESADHPDSEFRLRLRRSVWEAAREEVSRFHIRGYQAMASLLAALDAGARGSEEIVESLRLRDYWPVPAEPDRLHLLTFRDGALGPASWAVGFDLVPKLPPEEPEEEEELEGEGEPAAVEDGTVAEPLAPEEQPDVPADGGPRD